jgi:TetR/AcrR family transcriptional regulator
MVDSEATKTEQMPGPQEADERPEATGGTRDAVFRAAALEFGEGGYEAARVDAIADRAGVNKAMLYYHFGSKDALYREVLRDTFLAVSTRAAAVADGPGGAAAKLDALILTVVEEASARPWMPPIMLREVASGGAHLDPDTLGLMNAVYGALGRVIAQGQRDGVFRAVDPLLTHLTILPPVLIFLVRERMIAARTPTDGVLEPRRLDEFVAHVQGAARRMLRRDA